MHSNDEPTTALWLENECKRNFFHQLQNFFIFSVDIKDEKYIFAAPKTKRPVRLSVRTLGFHPRKRGSTPLRATKDPNSPKW